MPPYVRLKMQWATHVIVMISCLCYHPFHNVQFSLAWSGSNLEGTGVDRV
jgi:hypothetical protein